MSGVGNNPDGSFTFLDILSVLSFAIGLANYEENLTQSDKQELMEELNKRTEVLLSDIHKHLSSQDAKLDHIIKVLEDSNDS